MRPARTLLVLVVLTLMAWERSSLATPQQDAWRHYQALEYDQALVALAEAERNAASVGQLADALLLEGFVKIALARPDEALLAFRQALRRAPGVHPLPNTSPRILAVFEQAKELEAARTTRRATVRIRLDPPRLPEVALRTFDVTATVDAPFAGLTAMLALTDHKTGITTTLPLVAVGDTWVAHVPAPFAAIGANLELRASLVDEGDVIASTPAVSVTLPDHAAALRIESPLVGAHIYVDGAAVGAVPLAAAVPVTVGPHHLELRSGQGRVTQDLDAVAGETERVQLQVAPRPRLPVVRYVLLGVGAALAITGGVLFDQANRATSEYNRDVTRDPTSLLPTTPYAQASSAEANAHGYEIAAITLVAVGGAAIVTGLALFAVHPEGARARLAFDAHGAGVRF